MTAINPNTTVYALKTDLTPNNEDTILFTSLETQWNYMYSRRVKVYDDFTYQRERRNYIKVSDPNATIDKCNYLMFVNESYINKRYYAFIISVNWVNNETAEILYQIDYVQTFLFDFTLAPCWIERQHSTTDVAGDNVVPEPVELGEYVSNNDYAPINPKSDVSWGEFNAIVAISDVSGSVDGSLYDNNYSGAKLYNYQLNSSGVGPLNNLLNAYVSRPDAVLGIWVVPRIAVYGLANGAIPSYNTSTAAYVDCPAINPALSISLNGYIPKNKKMYTYPYNYYCIDNGAGDSLTLRYELCQNYTPRLAIDFTITQPVSVVVYPTNYKGLTPSQAVPNKTFRFESMRLPDLPMCSWSYDAYKEWLGRTVAPALLSMPLKAIGLAAQTGASLENARLMPSTRMFNAQNRSIMSGVANIGLSQSADFISSMYSASIAADPCRGGSASSTSLMAHGKYGIYGCRMSVMADYARTIDNFFTMYGYAQNRIATPVLNARKQFTYIKTRGINIHGNIPIDAKEAIEGRFNNGIRFWKTASQMDNYDVDNSPN